LLKLGLEMEHKNLRHDWKPEYVPLLRPNFKLHPWQEAGVTFLHKCREEKTYALLGDEMGVGKVDPSSTLLTGDRPFKRFHFYTQTIVILKESKPPKDG